MQAEVESVISAHSGTRDLHNLWYVFRPAGVDECITPGVCGTNAFGGYHSLSHVGRGVTIYAVTIDPLIEASIAPGADPEGHPDAETVNHGSAKITLRMRSHVPWGRRGPPAVRTALALGRFGHA